MDRRAAPSEPPSAAQERFRRTEAIFTEALKIGDPAARAQYVAEASAGDEHLAADVRQWLAGHDEVERSVHGDIHHALPIAQAVWQDAQTEARDTPEHVGRYRILGIIGTGGMGTVYEAEQDDPARRVALKLLHPELDDAALRKRFRSEADILARLHHDGIASVFDVGEVETQLGPRLFLAMERVHGLPLRTYLAEKALSREECLRLLLAICEAVEHAHRNGVIHRDLKPSNILIREDGAPKLLDFGVAREIDKESDLTKTGHIVGTYRYMSPEQADGSLGLVDSRSDVYALGMIGYEMLAGRHPREELTPPSGALARQVPSLGGIDPSLRGDLSIIFSKALEHDIDERYPDVAPFAEDLRRFLDDEPILARPRSGHYHFRKFVARNRVVVAAGSLAIAALVSALVLAIGSANREERYRRQSDETARAAERAAYIATIKAASSDIAATNPSSARHLLRDLPTEARGWEWHYLWAQLDRSAQVLPWNQGATKLSADERKILTVRQSPSGRLTVRGERIEPARDEHRPFAAEVDSDRELPPAFMDRVSTMRLDVGPTKHWLRDHGTLTLIDTRQTAPVRVIDTATEIHDIRLAPDGKTMAVAGRDQSIRLMDSQNGDLHGALQGHDRKVLRVIFDRDGQVLYSGDLSGVIATWDVARRVQLRALLGHARPIYQLGVFPDGSGMLSLDDASLRLWDFEAERRLHVMRRPVRDKGRFIYDLAVSPDGRHVASTSFVGELEVACSQTGRVLWKAQVPTEYSYPRTCTTRFSADGRWLAVSEGRLSLFDARTGRLAWRSDEGESITEFDFDSSAERLVAMSRNGVVALALGEGSITPLGVRKPMSEKTALALSPDGKTVAYADTTNLWLRSTTAGTLIWSASSEPARITELKFSPDGKTVAAACVDGLVRRWHADTGRPRPSLRGPNLRVYALALTADGKRMASGSRDGTIRLWDTETGENTIVIRAHDDYVHALAFDPGGETLYSGSGDGTVRSWSCRPFAERWAQRVDLLERRARLRTTVQKQMQALRDPEAVAVHLEEAEMDPKDRRVALDLVLELSEAGDSK